jgi:hypothetical protein
MLVLLRSLLLTRGGKLAGWALQVRQDLLDGLDLRLEVHQVRL